tara:strand:+ start:49 stop:507 length:459 start_codon:yes stop_codon:yes gene_type:complete
MVSNLCNFLGEEPPKNLRKCFKCKEEKTIDCFEIRSFGKKGHLEYRNDCKACRAYESKQREKVRKQNFESKPDADYKCPICERSEYDLTKDGAWVQTRKLKSHSVWALDHNIKTGEFRGYICNNCNVALGRFNDDPNAAFRAHLYLNGDLKL